LATDGTGVHETRHRDSRLAI